MSITYGDLLKIYPAFTELCRLRLPFQKARAIYRTEKDLKTEYDFYAAEERKLIDAHSARDEAGNPIIHANGMVKMASPSDKCAYQEEITTLKERDCDINVAAIQITADELGNQPISAQLMSALEGVVDFV